MTVPAKYVTLSNGKLVSQKKMRTAHELITGKWICPMHLIYFLWAWVIMQL